MAERADLRGDCSSCTALCCVAPGFRRSVQFGVDKPPGVACLHRAEDHTCSLHDQLHERGFPGCASFDCLGAGQQVVRHTYAGQDWRADPALAAQMFRVFSVMRELHELLWLLLEASELARAEQPGPRPDHRGADLVGASLRSAALTGATSEATTCEPPKTPFSHRC